MSGAFQLCCAVPERVADCVHDKLATIVKDLPAVVLYGALDGVYLEDVNDDPERVDDCDAGQQTWIDRACSVYLTLMGQAGGHWVRFARTWRHVQAPTEPEHIRRVFLSADRDTTAALWTAGAGQ